jgi:uracil-DNA glycosylase family 4
MEREAALAALEWQIALGADEAIGAVALDRFGLAELPPSGRRGASGRGAAPPASPAPPSPPAAPAPPPPPSAGAGTPERAAAAIAAGCGDLAALRAALEAFEGSGLKRGARSTVFADGLPGARVMVIGEAPGREEDAAGLPFVGRSGRLLDRMLAAIGLARDADDPARAVYITNVLPWRPPVNRDPAGDEVAMLKPFLFRHVELAGPDVLLLMGARAAQTMLETSEGIGRLRGRWTKWRTLPALPTLHPALLLRDPGRKRQAWADLLTLREFLDGSGP